MLLLRRARVDPARQRVFAFEERARRFDRRTKAAIALVTVMAVVGLLGGTPTGRHLVRRAEMRARPAGRWTIGLPPDHEDVDREWRLVRERGIQQTRALYKSLYPTFTPGFRRLVDFAGLDPDHAVLRWGNYDLTLLLPATTFLPDDTGRSYRMRPNTRSIWIKRIAMPGHLSGFFLVPDTAEARARVAEAGGFLVAGSSQTTNSWGLRGPEPDLSAPVRGLVLGDSNMQGLMIGDDETAPVRVQRELERSLKTQVSIVNTGHLGYSPEQFYYSLREYAPQFKPHFVLLTFCPNDFGNGAAVVEGHGDYTEAKYWFDRITFYCMHEEILLVVAPIPFESQIIASNRTGKYPGPLLDTAPWNSLSYCNPLNDFVDEFLKLQIEGARTGNFPAQCPLFNGHLGDAHFSARGAAVWGQAVGRRVSLLLKTRGTRGLGPLAETHRPAHASSLARASAGADRP